MSGNATLMSRRIRRVLLVCIDGRNGKAIVKQ